MLLLHFDRKLQRTSFAPSKTNINPENDCSPNGISSSRGPPFSGGPAVSSGPIDPVGWPKRRDCWWKGSGNFIDMRAMPKLLFYMMEVHSRTHCFHETIFHVSLFRTICKHAWLYIVLPLLKNIEKLHTQFTNKNKESSKYNSPSTFKHVLSNKNTHTRHHELFKHLPDSNELGRLSFPSVCCRLRKVSRSNKAAA